MTERETHEKGELKEVVEQCVDAVAEVLAEDNQVLFVGRITEFDSRREEIRIDLERAGETPQGLLYNAPIKVQIHLRNQWKTVVMLYGNVVLCAKFHWRVKIRNAISCADSRRAFRQKVRVDGWITWEDQGRFRQACSLVDISLVGVAFYTSVKLDEGTDVKLVIPYLVQGGPSHQLSCTIVVRRSASEDDPPTLWRYGCSYHSLSEQEEDRLCKDIFLLQAQNLKRERGQ